MRIYLDHAATTPTAPEVLDAMIPWFSENFGNASSLSCEGQKSREALDDARLSISKILQCSLDEIIFTSGATESNNLALFGVFHAWKKKYPEKIPHIISTAIEHSSVRNVLKFLEEEELAEITFLPVSQEGIVNVEELKNSIQENTILVSVQAVNNEVGSIQPVARIGRLTQKYDIVFHIDAVQAFGHIKTSAEAWKCDLLSLSAHKFYGPKGIGILFVKQGTEMMAEILGGGQERKYRAGTENVAGIVGMQKAMEMAEERREEEEKRLRELQIWGKNWIEKNMTNVMWNGPEMGENRIANNLHFSFGEVDGESILMRMDLEGVAISLGSACASGLLSPSHVLLAMGQTEANARSGVRMTMGKNTTQENLHCALEKLKKVVENLRETQEFF